MPPDNINERVAILEFQVNGHSKTIEDFTAFKETMLVQLSELRNSITLLSWKVGAIIGGIVLLGDQLIQWGLRHLLP